MKLKWWIIRSPLYNSAILILFSVKIVEAYFYPLVKPPESSVRHVAIDFIEVILVLNAAYWLGPVLEAILIRTGVSINLRWLIFGLGTILALAVGTGAASLILTPF
jgi:uncharacterized membrane protein required for colicin V production